MAKGKLPRLVIFGDPKKGHVADVIREFSEFVKGRARIAASSDIGKCTAGVLEHVDFAVVFGGDGTIISAARQLSKSKVPVIGVNLGKLGYLAEFGVGELKELFDDITAGKAPIEKRMMLGCRVFISGAEKKRRGTRAPSGAEKFSSAAINDIFITAGPPFRMVELQISVDGQAVGGCVSDGLIISTPTGSTAYNLSAGGPILAGNMKAMVVTPICPHSLSFRPIVIDAASTVEVFGIRVNDGTTVSIDGQISCELGVDDVVRVERHRGDFLVVNNPLRTKWDTLAAKLGWAEKPKYGLV